MSFNAWSLAKTPTRSPGAAIFRSQFFIAGTEVIADDWLCALGQSGQGQRQNLHDTCQDGHGAHRQISAVFLQRGIKANAQQALGALHNKWRQAKRQDRHQDSFGNFHI